MRAGPPFPFLKSRLFRIDLPGPKIPPHPPAGSHSKTRTSEREKDLVSFYSSARKYVMRNKTVKPPKYATERMNLPYFLPPFKIFQLFCSFYTKIRPWNRTQSIKLYDFSRLFANSILTGLHFRQSFYNLTD